MRYLKSILWALAFSVLLLAGAGIFLQPAYSVEKSIVIRSSPDSIYSRLINLRKWPLWSAWNTRKDPSLKFSYQGAESGVGSIQEWEGESLGKGALEIMEAKNRQVIACNLKLEEDFISRSTMTLEPEKGATKIRWKMQGDVGYNIPQRYFILFIGNLIGPDMEEGLKNLKNICESK